MRQASANHRWTDGDDVAALYVYRFGLRGIASSRPALAQALGISSGSFGMRIQNVSFLATGSGLPNYSKRTERNLRSASRDSRTGIASHRTCRNSETKICIEKEPLGINRFPNEYTLTLANDEGHYVEKATKKRGAGTGAKRGKNRAGPQDKNPFNDILTDYEKGLLEKLKVELRPIGFTCHKKLNEPELRSIAHVLVALAKRMGKKPKKAKLTGVEFPVGDWLNYVDQSHSINQGITWLNEAVVLQDYRDHLLKLAGATLIQLQHLEQLIKSCCDFLDVENDRKKSTYKDLLSPNPKRQVKTLGMLKNFLKTRKDVNGNQIFVSAFEARLDQFVRDRNTFIHEFWVNLVSTDSGSSPPSLDALHTTNKFLVNLLTEAVDLIAPFSGLFYTIGKESAGTRDIRTLENTVFFELSKYEKDFLEVRPLFRPTQD